MRDYYEREHQPQALREASLYLQRLTSGRYTRVWTPLGEHSLRVDDSAGTSLRVEVLSRGTREQLFLALRLALVSAYARRGVQLPLVLDDVLVNFDVGRAKAAAMVLRDFARQGHQILIFTCHEHIAKLFKNIKAEVRQLPDNAQPHAAALAEQARQARARRTRPESPFEPEPEPEEELEPDADEVEIEPSDPPAAVAEISPPIVPAPGPSPLNPHGPRRSSRAAAPSEPAHGPRQRTPDRTLELVCRGIRRRAGRSSSPTRNVRKIPTRPFRATTPTRHRVRRGRTKFDGKWCVNAPLDVILRTYRADCVAAGIAWSR